MLNVFLEPPSKLGYVRVAEVISNNRNRAIGETLFERPLWPGRIVGYNILSDTTKQIGSRQFKRKVYYVLATDWVNWPNNHLNEMVIPEDGIAIKELLAQAKWEVKRFSHNRYHHRKFVTREAIDSSEVSK